MLPPATILLRGPFKPDLRISRSLAIGEEGRLRVAGRIKNTLDMTAVTQDIFAFAEQQTRMVARLPRHNVVGYPGNIIKIAIHLRKIDRHATHGQFARYWQRVLLVQVQ